MGVIRHHHSPTNKQKGEEIVSGHTHRRIEEPWMKDEAVVFVIPKSYPPETTISHRPWLDHGSLQREEGVKERIPVMIPVALQRRLAHSRKDEMGLRPCAKQKSATVETLLHHTFIKSIIQVC